MCVEHLRSLNGRLIGGAGADTITSERQRIPLTVDHTAEMRK
jgi:hypothetical protein